MERTARPISPWTYVPLLYFMQAIPVAVVQEVATIFFKDLGVANEPITRWTSLIAIPWSLQLLLGPMVDLNFTKRRWILGGQAVIAIGLVIAALLLQTPHPFELTLVVLGATAITSALCNIATDGFYILSMAREQQAAFVGIQTTCYRLGRLFCVGLLVKAAGKLADGGMAVSAAWGGVLLAASAVYGLGHLINRRMVPTVQEDQPAAESAPGENRQNLIRTVLLLASALSAYFLANSGVRLAAHGIHLGLGGLPGWQLPSRGSILGIDLGLGGVGTELLQVLVTAPIAVLSVVASRRLLRGTEMARAFGSYIRQPSIAAILAFIVFYRLGEAMVAKMSPLFYKDSLANGGLALSNDQIGNIKGFVGVIGIVLGGLLGGWVVSRIPLRRAFWPLAIAMHSPNLLYLWASTQRPPLAALYGIEFIDQFGYGFGFAAYFVYLMQVAQRGSFKTTHYAIGTGLGALCIALAGILSGILQSNLGYHGFFLAVVFCTIPGMLTLLFIPLDEPAPTTEGATSKAA